MSSIKLYNEDVMNAKKIENRHEAIYGRRIYNPSATCSVYGAERSAQC